MVYFVVVARVLASVVHVTNVYRLSRSAKVSLCEHATIKAYAFFRILLSRKRDTFSSTFRITVGTIG